MAVRRWLRHRRDRTAIAYVGTDHALTDAEALNRMLEDGVHVRMMLSYVGTFHPKVVWLSGSRRNILWAGSNNITQEGLRWNIEFATVTKFKTRYRGLQRWFRMIHEASVDATIEQIEDYRQQRLRYGRQRATAGTFTWVGRHQVRVARRMVQPRAARRRGPAGRLIDPVGRGDLVIEIMPRETGSAGNQVQVPKEVAVSFFGLPNRVGASINVRLSNVHTASSRILRLTLFRNQTTCNAPL